MIRLLITALLALATAFAATFATALLLLASQDWFGSGDLTALAVWTVPLALFLAIMAVPIGHIRRSLAIPTAVVGGAIAGFLFTVTVAISMGPWFGAFSFPPLYCWMASGISALLVAALVPRSVSA